MKTIFLFACCLAFSYAFANQAESDEDIIKTRGRRTHNHGCHSSKNCGRLRAHHHHERRKGNEIERHGPFDKRDTTVSGHADKDGNGNHIGGKIDHTSEDGKTHAEGHVEHSSNGGTSYGGSFSHKFGKRELKDKRDTSIGGHIEKDNNGNTHIGGNINHDFGNGGSISGNVDHSSRGGTNYGISGGKSWNGGRTSVSGNFNHNSNGGNSFGLNFEHKFGKRLAELETAVKEIAEIYKRDTTVSGHADKDGNGNHIGGKIDHTSEDGKTHTEGHVEHSSNGGTSYGGSFSHKFGKRELKDKRDTSIGGHIEKDNNDNTHIGGNINHDFGNGGSISGNVDHSSRGGTNYGISGGKSWNGGRTSVSGNFNHNSNGGNSFGLNFEHKFGKRLAELETAVKEIAEIYKRDTTVSGHADKDGNGNHIGGKIDHTSEDGKTHTEGHVEHSSNGGTSYGGSFSHKFGKRELKDKRDTSIGGHIEKDNNGNTHIGGNINHDFGNGGSISGNVDHSSRGGTNYGISGGKSWNGGRTSVSGNFNHNSNGGNSFGLNFEHKFGKRLAELETAVKEIAEIYKRDTTVSGHADKDGNGNHIGGKIDHTSEDGKTHTEGHVEHSSNGGTSYGGSFSHKFGKRELKDKRDTSIGGHIEKDNNGNTHIGGNINHDFGNGGSISGNVDHSSRGGTNYGISGGKSWNGGRTSVSGNFNHNSNGGNSFGLNFEHKFGKRLAELETAVKEIAEIYKRDITVSGHADKDGNGNHIGGKIDHTSEDGKTHTEGHVEHSSNGGTSYGGSFSHKFGKRELKDKRDTSIGGHIEKDNNGNTHIGGNINHDFGNGGSISGNVDHSSRGGTNYGISGGKSWNGGRTSVSGNFNHNSNGGNSFGLNFEHKFGKRLAELETAVKEIAEIYKRDTTVSGHADKDGNGNHIGGKIDHTSEDGKTHTEGHVEHSSNGGTSYGGSFSHKFGKRELKDKRDTSIGGHIEKDNNGNAHIGGNINHDFGNGGSISGNVDHSSRGGTNYGISGGKSWNGGRTSVSGNFNHNSHGGNSFGLNFEHKFGKWLAE